MGSFASKLFYTREQDQEQTGASDESGSSTPMKYAITPPMRRKTLITDPRSASSEIPRTPIDVPDFVTPTPPKPSHRAASAIPRRLQVKPYLETNFDATLPTSVVKDLDPRSPNVPQPRTPITFPKTSDSAFVEIPEKSLENDNVCQDPRSPSFDFDRTPILKPKSPLNNHKRVNKTNAEAQLSFCETTSFDNVPEVQALPDIIENLKIVDLPREDANGKEKIILSPDLDKECLRKSKKDLFHRIDEILISAAKRNLESEVIASEIGSEDKTLIWQDLGTDVPDCEIDAEEKISIWKDLEKATEQPEIEAEEGDTVEDVKDKADEVVIEVDEEERGDKTILKGSKLKMQAPGQNRTPLGNRSNNRDVAHKKSKTSTQPAIKNKAIFSKNQQENTPPGRKSTRSKLNGTQWDPNNTVLI